MIRFTDAEPMKVRPAAPASTAKPAEAEASDGAVASAPAKRGRPRKAPKAR